MVVLGTYMGKEDEPKSMVIGLNGSLYGLACGAATHSCPHNSLFEDVKSQSAPNFVLAYTVRVVTFHVLSLVLSKGVTYSEVPCYVNRGCVRVTLIHYGETRPKFLSNGELKSNRAHTKSGVMLCLC